MWWSTGSRAGRTSGNRLRGRKDSQAGFTLLEILVAFTVLALMLGALLPTFSAGLRLLDAAQSAVQSVLLVQSRIEAVGIETPLEEGEQRGRLEDGSEWVVRVRQVAIAAERPENKNDTLPFEAFEIEAEILKDGATQIALKTLRLAPIDEHGILRRDTEGEGNAEE